VVGVGGKPVIEQSPRDAFGCLREQHKDGFFWRAGSRHSGADEAGDIDRRVRVKHQVEHEALGQAAGLDAGVKAGSCLDNQVHAILVPVTLLCGVPLLESSCLHAPDWFGRGRAVEAEQWIAIGGSGAA
jgi:hypothetical protein